MLIGRKWQFLGAYYIQDIAHDILANHNINVQDIAEDILADIVVHEIASNDNDTLTFR